MALRRGDPFQANAFAAQPVECYSQAQVRSVEQEVLTHLHSNPNSLVQVKLKYFDKDSRNWVYREGNVAAQNNQLFFAGTDGANGDADEEPIQWPVPGARYGEIALNMVAESIQQATNITREGIQAATLLSANQQFFNHETAQSLRDQQAALDRARDDHRDTVRLTTEAMTRARAQLDADRAANNGTEAQLEERAKTLRSMEADLTTREKEFKMWMTEGNDEMLQAARNIVEKEFRPPQTPLRARASAATQMTPTQPIATATTTTATLPPPAPTHEFRAPLFTRAPSIQTSATSFPRRGQQPARHIVFDDPYDVDQEDDENFEDEDDGFAPSAQSQQSFSTRVGDVAADSFAFDPKRWGGLNPVQQQSLLMYINQRTKTSKPAQGYLVEDFLRMLKGLLQLAEVSPNITKQEGFLTTATTIIKRLRMVTMLSEGQSASFVGFFADEVSGAGQPEYLRQAERRAAKLATAAAAVPKNTGGGGGGGGATTQGGRGGRGRGSGKTGRG